MDRVRVRIGERIGERGHWLGFLLFLGLVGGLLSFGTKGFIIGPVSVVLVATLGSFWLPLYGVGRGSTTPAAVDSSADGQASGP
jgi:predicted PurR-regulated permease PerM